MTPLTVHAGLALRPADVRQAVGPEPRRAAPGRRHRHQPPSSTDTQQPRVRGSVSRGRPGIKKYVVRAGYGIFYGRTPSIMVGTAHSNNGINVATITFTGGARCRPIPNTFATIPIGRRAAEADTSSISTRTTRIRKVQQASAGPRVGAEQQHVASHGELSLRARRPSCRARPTSTSGLRSPVTLRSRRPGQALPQLPVRHPQSVHELRAGIISFQSTPASRPTTASRWRAHRRFAERAPGTAPPTPLGKVDRHRPRRHRRRPRQRRRRRKFASNPADFEADRAHRQQRPAAPARR